MEMEYEVMLLISIIDFLIEQRESILLGYEKFIERSEQEMMSKTILTLGRQSYEDRLSKVNRLIEMNKAVLEKVK